MVIYDQNGLTSLAEWVTLNPDLWINITKNDRLATGEQGLGNNMWFYTKHISK